jgi:hypothetical protein
MIVKCRKNLGRHLRQLRHERRCCPSVGELCSLRSAILAESRFKMLLGALTRGRFGEKSEITRRPQATIATVATNAFMFMVRSKTVAEVANVAPPTGDMPHRLASLRLPKKELKIKVERLERPIGRSEDMAKLLLCSQSVARVATVAGLVGVI